METINAPKHEPGSDEYNLDCQAALEHGFQAFADAARAAGWDKGEVAYALLELAHYNLKGMIADGETQCCCPRMIGQDQTDCWDAMNSRGER